MNPVNQPITLWRGDYFSMGMRLRDTVWNPALNDGEGGYEPGDYQDLTGCTVAGHIRRTPDDPEILASFTGTILDQSDPDTKGRILWELFHEDTKDLPLNPDAKTKWGYDLQVSSPDGEPDTPQYGSVTVKGDYTHD